MPRFSPLIVALLAAIAAGLCFYARADHLGLVLALVACIKAVDFAIAWRRDAAAARDFDKAAPFVRLTGKVGDDTH